MLEVKYCLSLRIYWKKGIAKRKFSHECKLFVSTKEKNYRLLIDFKQMALR